METNFRKDKVWLEIAQKFPTEQTPQAKKAREQLWKSFDSDGSGYVSLKEVEKAFGNLIKLPSSLNIKPVLLEAFNHAKSKFESKTSIGDDNVSKAEFPYLLIYFKKYYELWMAFNVIDANKDATVSKDEFVKAADILELMGIDMSNPDALFKEADKDGGGSVKFNEFSSWAVKKSLERKFARDKMAAELALKLPFENTPEQKKRRDEIWKVFDVNGNGYCSLAEIDRAIQVLDLPNLFSLKPVLMRAFQAAKQRVVSKTKYGDDYVTLPEFKYVLLYLRKYYELWSVFDKIDSDDDRRVELKEFIRAKDTLEEWGIDMSDPNTTFKQADGDGKGMILFIEFCDWAIKQNVIEIDDDES